MAAAKDNKPEDVIGNALIEDSDKGCVLVGIAYIDFRLEELLRAAFKKVADVDDKLVNDVLDYESVTALFHTIAAKAKAARLFGHIDRETYSIINKLAHMRNKFAHKPGKATLTEPSIQALISSLGKDRQKYLKNQVAMYESGQTNLFWRSISDNKDFSISRVKFMSICLSINVYLNDRIVELDPLAIDGRNLIGKKERPPTADRAQ